MKNALIIIINLLALVGQLVPHAPAGCLSSMEIRSQFVIPSEPYDACNSEMRTTFSWRGKGIGGYLVVKCEVFNTPFVREYWVWNCPGETGSITEWTHCENLNGHRLRMDIQPYIHYELGFSGDCTFRADYFAEKEQ